MFEFSLYFVHSKKPNIHDFETETLGKKKILNDAIYASLFLFVSYLSPISTYVIDPAARLKKWLGTKGP